MTSDGHGLAADLDVSVAEHRRCGKLVGGGPSERHGRPFVGDHFVSSAALPEKVSTANPPSEPREVWVTDEDYRAALDGLHILVIDDDDDSRVLMDTMLRGYGAVITAVESAMRARQALANGLRPDVIVSDLAMPVEDGPGLLHELRADPNYADVPALAVTAYAHQFLSEALRAAGFSAILRKPLSPDEFARAVIAVGAARGPRRRGPTPPANQ
jgi:CheY-like chemotaxis protein